VKNQLTLDMKFSASQKILLLLTSILFISFTTINEDPKDRLNVKGPLSFGNTSFKLSWTARPKETYFVQEYLPDGESLNSFNQMLTINLFVSDIEVKNAVDQKINELTKRKKTDKVCNYAVNESPDGKEFIVDFLVSETKDNKMTTVEFNVYRYKQIDIEGFKKAIVVYSYSKRAYGNEITTFLESLGKERANYLNYMISSEIPAVKISDN